MKISILGAGRWASCLALLMDRKGYKVLMWERPDEKYKSPLFTTGKNQFVSLSENVSYTHDLNEALNYSEYVIISILSQQVSNLMENVKKVAGYEDKKYVLAMKGIELSTGRRLSEILLDNGVKKNNIGVLAGPGHAQSIAKKQSTNMIVSAYSDKLMSELKNMLSTPHEFDLSVSHDIIGTEIGAAAKNVMGIAAGILDGGKMEQKKGPLMVASVKEMQKFILAQGGDVETASGLAFLGDFHATMYDDSSKNLTYGRSIINYNTIDVGKLNENLPFDVRSVEGVPTSQALVRKMIELNKRLNDEREVKMPITTAICDIVSNKVPLKDAVELINDRITESIELE